jgi:predicted amidohydrolase YtcJ
VWTNGIVETMEAHQPYAEAFTIRNGKFIAVGSNAEITNLMGPETKHHDLHGVLSDECELVSVWQ